MLPQKFTAVDPEAERRRYKVVRLDTFNDVAPGSLILSASVDSGLCLLRQPNGANQEFSFGPNGISIVLASR
jgi:hypothetical protein